MKAFVTQLNPFVLNNKVSVWMFTILSGSDRISFSQGG